MESLGAGVPLRIMPLGASITYGQASSDQNGYREALRKSLTEAGNPVNMVGSRANGNMKDNDVEGWPGWRVLEIHAKANESLPTYKPNVVLINAGTNDAVQDFNITTTGDRMESMVEDIFKYSPRAVVVLSTLIFNQNPAYETRVRNVNEQYRNVVRKQRGKGRKIIVAEMHEANGPGNSDMADETHPNDIGYRKMANIWYSALLQVSDNGWLQRPEPVAGLPDNGP